MSVKLTKHLARGPGVYIFKNRQGAVYVGKSTNVYERVKSHLSSKGSKAQTIRQEADRVEVIPVGYELEALLLEAQLIQKYKPRFNTRAKDDKHPLYIKITGGDAYPRVTTSRLESADRRRKNAVYFGPFPSTGTVKAVLRSLRKIFPFHSQKVGKKACFYSHLGLCSPCPNEISKIKNQNAKRRLTRIYKGNIKSIQNILDGKADVLGKHLQRNMQKAAKLEDFEEAARYRDQLQRLEYITSPYKPASAYLENPSLLADIHTKEARELAKTLEGKLKIRVLPARIECFDVAHLRGENATASMVTFVDGEPEKNFYRHFRIRAKSKMDDTAAMSEVLQRRIEHFKDWGRPDLFIVDGGKGQISTGVQVLQQANVRIPLVGLAKRNEEIIALKYNPHLGTRTFRAVRLPRSSPALQLLQRIRDEAHRFARSYHLKLRMKALHT